MSYEVVMIESVFVSDADNWAWNEGILFLAAPSLGKKKFHVFIYLCVW